MPAQDRADLALFRNEAGRAIDGLSVGSLAREEYVRTVIVTCDHNTAAPPLAARNEVVLLLEIAAVSGPGDPGRGPQALVVLAQKNIGDTSDRRSEEHTSELQSLMRISYAVFCLKTKRYKSYIQNRHIMTNKPNINQDTYLT